MRIAIASGKGGTGKTTLAVNLAMKASEQQSILLMDLDVEEPNSGIFIHADIVEEHQMFRLVPQWNKNICSSCGKCVSLCRYNALLKLGDQILVLPDLCHGCHACSELCPENALPMVNVPLGSLKHFRKASLDFVESKLDVGVEQAAPLIAKSIDLADEVFYDKDFQIVDCPPGTSCAMISATKTADYVILVTEPTPFGLYDLTLAIDTMKHLEKPFGVVVNRYGIGNDDVFKYLESESIPLLAAIPNQRKIAELYSKGKLLYPAVSEVEDALENILNHLKELSCEKS